MTAEEYVAIDDTLETGQALDVDDILCLVNRDEVPDAATNPCRKNCYIKKILLLWCIHHFKLDLIYNMDNLRISGNESSTVIHSQTKWYQTFRMMSRKYQKPAEAKRDGVINPQNYNFNQFKYGKVWCY